VSLIKFNSITYNMLKLVSPDRSDKTSLAGMDDWRVYSLKFPAKLGETVHED
jgi:hypothetical protein